MPINIYTYKYIYSINIIYAHEYYAFLYYIYMYIINIHIGS